MQSNVTFESLEIDTVFFDPNTGENYQKVCGNAAQFLTGGEYFSGHLATFESNELVQQIGVNHAK